MNRLDEWMRCMTLLGVGLVIASAAAADDAANDAVDAVDAAADAPTWSGQVAAIVHQRCAGCHQPGQSGPFDLLSYDDAVEHGETMVAVIDADYMPPWPPSTAPPLQHDRRLPEAEADAIRRWVEADMPAGDLDAAPQPPLAVDGWRLGTPDLVVEMDRAYRVPADGRDIYRWFVLPLDLPEDRYIEAIEFQPTARGAVHHVLFYYDTTGQGRRKQARQQRSAQPGFGGMKTSPQAMLGGYVPGAVPQKWPDGVSVKLPAGSDLILQTHFHPSGRVESERSRVALHFADAPPERPLISVQLPPLFGQGVGLDIPAGQSEYVLEDSMTLPTPVTAVGVSGHAHYVCTEMAMTATLPDGSEQTLLGIDEWDLDWQGDYLFEQPVELPAGTELHVRLVYDNSAANPENPFSPPRRIKWGPQSTDEMGSMTLSVLTPDGPSDLKLASGLKRHLVLTRLPRGELQRRMAQLPRPSLGERLWFGYLDKDNDGKLQTGEIPAKWHELHFLLDVDLDGGVSQTELDALRAFTAK